MSIRRRLEVLEAQTPAPETPERSEARARMKAHLDQIVRYRRGELGPEEAAEVEALTAAFSSVSGPGGGGRVVVDGEMSGDY